MAAMTDAIHRYKDMIETPVIRTLMSLDVFDALAANDGIATLDQLVDQTSANAALLCRLLRVVASTGFIVFDPESDTYAHTEVSRGYCTGQVSADFFTLVHDEVLSTAVCLPAWIRRRGRMADPAGPESLTHNACTFRHDKEGSTFFDILCADPARERAFHRGMPAMVELHPYRGIYDFSTLSRVADRTPHRMLLVDIGGGDGQFLKTLLDDHPSLPASRLVLQDVPSVIDAVCNDKGRLSDVGFQYHDFLREPQPFRGAHMYHIRACLHDYGDDKCIVILRHIASAMATDSILLIEENIMSERPSKGEMSAIGDITMMLLGGRERTEEDWNKVLQEAGLKIREIFRAQAPLTWCVMEVMLNTQWRGGHRNSL